MCAKCGYEDLLAQIETMQESGDYDWAADTLLGIQETVSDREHCTGPQQFAIDNIEESINR